MKILIDGRSDILSSDNGYSVGEILRQIEEFLLKIGRISLGATLDGTPLMRDNSKVLEKLVDDYEVLEIKTGEIRRQAYNALSEVKAHLPGIVQKVKNVSERIQSGELVQGYKTLAGCADLMNGMVRVIEEVKTLAGVDLNELELPGDSVTERLKVVSEVLGRTKEALDARDTVTVADMMEYELAPNLERWNEILEGLLEKMGEC